jgi:hypothetical protein
MKNFDRKISGEEFSSVNHSRRNFVEKCYGKELLDERGRPGRLVSQLVCYRQLWHADVSLGTHDNCQCWISKQNKPCNLIYSWTLPTASNRDAVPLQTDGRRPKRRGHLCYAHWHYEGSSCGVKSLPPRKLATQCLQCLLHLSFLFFILFAWWTPRGSVIGWRTMLQAGWSRVRFPMRTLDFFNWPNPSSPTMALGSTQPLTEISTRNLPGG